MSQPASGQPYRGRLATHTRLPQEGVPRDQAIATGHSRFPVTGGDLDDVVGVVHVKDVYEVAHADWPTTLVTASNREVVTKCWCLST